MCQYPATYFAGNISYDIRKNICITGFVYYIYLYISETASFNINVWNE